MGRNLGQHFLELLDGYLSLTSKFSSSCVALGGGGSPLRLGQEVLREQKEASLDSHRREHREVPVGLGKRSLDLVEDLAGNVFDPVLAEHLLAVGEAPSEKGYAGGEDGSEPSRALSHVVCQGDLLSHDLNRLQHDEDLRVCIHVDCGLASLELLESWDSKAIVR